LLAKKGALTLISPWDLRASTSSPLTPQLPNQKEKNDENRGKTILN